MQVNRAQQLRTGYVAILWDMENCPVPSDVKPDEVAGNIRKALRLHPGMHDVVSLFSAYGDFNHFPRKVREGCQRTGVNLIDVPNGKKDATDKAILVDMFLFALDNRPPCTIFLISGDVDFAPALHKLGQRGYTVVMAIPSGVGVSSALCSAGRYVWDWPSVAKGEGLILARNVSSKVFTEDRMVENMELDGFAGRVLPLPTLKDSTDQASAQHVPADEEQIVWKSPTTRKCTIDNSSSPESEAMSISAQKPLPARPQDSSQLITSSVELSFVQGSVGAKSATSTLEMIRAQASSVGSPVASGGTSQAVTAQAKSLHALRDQLLKVLSLHMGKLELVRVPAEYRKHYGKPLALAEHGYAGSKLANLLERLRDWLFVKGDGINKTLHPTKSGSRVAAKLRRDAKIGRPLQREDVEVNLITLHDVGGDEDKPAKDDGYVASLIKELDHRNVEEDKAARGEGFVDQLIQELDQRSNEDEVVKGEGFVINLIELDHRSDDEKVVKGEGLVTDPLQELDQSIDEDKVVKGGDFHISPMQDLDQGIDVDKTLKVEGFVDNPMQEPNKKNELEIIQTLGFHWRIESGGSGDEKDSALQEEKDVEVDESTLEPVLKNEDNVGSQETDILKDFRRELEELLVSYACKIDMASFQALYQQRYSRVLDFSKFGVEDLESLIAQVSDIAVIANDQGGNGKVLVASGGLDPLS